MQDGQTSTERRQLQRKHIFAINGAPEFLDVLRDLLQDEQFNVTTTNYLPQTFDQIAAVEPDLIITDLVIGERAGWELLEHLQAEAITRQIPVLVTSTDQHLLDRAQGDAARYGAQRFVVKPLDIDELLQTIHQMIGPA